MRTPAERKADERQRHMDAGRVPTTVYTRPEQRTRLHKYVARLAREANQQSKHR